MRKINADVGAHIAVNDEKMKKMEDLLMAFMDPMPADVRDSYIAPKAKTTNDRFDLLIKTVVTKTSAKIKASGIDEECGELQRLLDDLISERDEHDEELRKKQDANKAVKRMSERTKS